MPKTTRQRSPSYPRASLRETVEKVLKVQKMHGTASVDRETAITTMGYTSSNSGAATGALSSALSYGLMEKRGTGSVGVSTLGMHVLVAEGDERTDALWEAARTPALHQQLEGVYAGDEIPSQKTVESYLQLNGFTSAAATVAAKGYIEAIQLAGHKTANESDGAPAGAGRSVVDQQHHGGVPMTTQTGSAPEVSGGLQLSVPLRDGNTFTFTSREPMTADDFSVVQSVLDALKLTAVSVRGDDAVEAAEPESEAVT